jgi:DNA-binding transcriptional ArsR family regulator
MKPTNAEPEPTPAVPTCTHTPNPLGALVRRADEQKAVERAARLFRALGDGPRLRILNLLVAGEVCVGEVVAAFGEKFSTISQRLRILRTEGLVTRRRDGAHVYYALADAHVKDLVTNALAHAAELNGPSRTTQAIQKEDEE